MGILLAGFSLYREYKKSFAIAWLKISFCFFILVRKDVDKKGLLINKKMGDMTLFKRNDDGCQPYRDKDI